MKIFKNLGLDACLVAILLVTACNAHIGGSIKITSSAGFATAFYVDFVKDGNVTTYETSTFISGGSRTLHVPVGAEEVRLRVEFIFFIGVWREAFRVSWATPPNSCWEIWGTTTNPKYHEVPCDGIVWRDRWANNCDWPGNDLASAKTRAEDCLDKCLETENCTHFTWNKVDNGTCWMKKGSVCKANAFYRSEHVCGLVTRCEEDYYPIKWYGGWANNCDLPGQNLTYTIDRGEDCANRCRQIKGCTHFSYDGKVCWLKQGEACKRDMVYDYRKGTACGILKPCRTELW